MSLLNHTATELLDSLQKGAFSSEDLTRACLDAIKQKEPRLKAFLHVNEENALAQAKAVDARRHQGERLGKLAGLPVALKDVLCTQGHKTTCGSKILQDFVPPFDAHVVTRLKEEDAVLLGKTNMDEFAMGSSTENSAYQVTRNPWDTARIPGGSSGGSAVAVAGREAPLSLGTDTGGSIRQPASLCGIVGMKPSYGRVSRFGLVAFASSLDQIGPFARTVKDAALLLETIAGHDRRDSTCVDQPVPAYSQTVDTPFHGITIGVAKEFFGAGLDPEVGAAVQAAMQEYLKLGAKIKSVSLPSSKYAVGVYYLVATAEASSNLARYDGVHYGHRAKKFDSMIHMYSRSRGEGFGPEVKRRIMLGTFALSSGYHDAYYVKALKVRRLIKNDFDSVFADCDVILGPTSPTAAFKIGEKVADPLSMYLSDIYTISANLAGICGISIPCGFTQAGLPIGLQLQAPALAEEKLLRIARMYEKTTDWHTRQPPV